MKKFVKLALFIFIISLVFQVGFVTFAIVNNTNYEQVSPNQSQQEVAEASVIVISEDALNAIKHANPKNHVSKIADYRGLLVSLNVPEQYNDEIERLIIDGHPLGDVLIGYEFLHQSFGKISELELIVAQRAAGIPWGEVFANYNAEHEPFSPRTFDSDYLENLMNTPSLTADDIMIADQISFATGKSFHDIMDAKLETEHWKSITTVEGILFSNDSLPRVQITIEQLNQFMGQGSLTEEQIVEAIVLAHKLGIDAEVVVDRFIAGASIEMIMADSYMEKYQ